MDKPLPDNLRARRRFATYVFLFIPGFLLASWAVRTPTIRDALGATTAGMGLLLFGLSIGSMTGILGSTPLVRRFGTRPVIGGGLSVLVSGVVLVALGSGLSSAPLVFTGLVFFGLGIGSAEVAINLEGAEVERLSGAPVLVEMHGCFSAGTLLGAVIGIALTSLEVPVLPSLLVLAALTVPVLLWVLDGIEPGFGRRVLVRSTSSKDESGRAPSTVPDAPPVALPGRHEPLWKDVRLLLISVILLAVALAEGSATDWLPLIMVDGFGLAESSGSLVFAGFAATMTLGRFGGRFLLVRFGRVTMLRAGSLLAATGLATVIFVDSPVLAGIAVTLWGLGISLGFPIAIGAAGDSGPDPVARVGLVATAGYIAFLVGPPLLGFLGQQFGLRYAMLVVFAALATTALIAPAANPRRPSRIASER